MRQRVATMMAWGAALVRLARGLVGLRDAFVFGGLACLAYGISQVYPPAAWMVVGLVLMLLGLRASTAK